MISKILIASIRLRLTEVTTLGQYKRAGSPEVGTRPYTEYPEFVQKRICRTHAGAALAEWGTEVSPPRQLNLLGMPTTAHRRETSSATLHPR